MRFSPKALLILVTFFALFALTLSWPGSVWVYLADGVASIIILLSLGGFLRSRARAR